MKLIFILFIILTSSIQGSSGNPKEYENFFTARNMKCLADNRTIGGINCAESLVQLRNIFVQKVKLWEQIHNRPITKRDLINPYLIKCTDSTLKLKTINVLSHFMENIDTLSSSERTYWKTLIHGTAEWSMLSRLFSFPAVALSESPIYEELFGLQLKLECARCRGEQLHYANRKDILAKPDNFEIYETSVKISDEQWSMITEKLQLNFKELTLNPNPNSFWISPLRDLELIGTVPDAPKMHEGMGHKLRRWLHREPAPEPILAELPISSPDAGWRYLHEVPGKGFSIFMHVFPDLRDEIADFDAYGMAISPEIIASLQTFHPPGYLPLMATPVQNPMVRVPGTVSEDISVSGATTVGPHSTTVASGALEETIGTSRSSAGAGAGSGAPPSSTISLTTSSTASTVPQGITANATTAQVIEGEGISAAVNPSETESGIRRRAIISSIPATGTEDPFHPLLSSQGKYT